jgi:hypothetical protein
MTLSEIRQAPIGKRANPPGSRGAISVAAAAARRPIGRIRAAD